MSPAQSPPMSEKMDKKVDILEEETNTNCRSLNERI